MLDDVVKRRSQIAGGVEANQAQQTTSLVFRALLTEPFELRKADYSRDGPSMPRDDHLPTGFCLFDTGGERGFRFCDGYLLGHAVSWYGQYDYTWKTRRRQRHLDAIDCGLQRSGVDARTTANWA